MKIAAIREDGSLNVIVELPRGATVKLQDDLELDRIVLSRPLPAGIVYPHDWGFVPSTRAADGDPGRDDRLGRRQLPGRLVPCRAIGILNVEQTNLKSGARERNDRLAVLRSPRALRGDRNHLRFARTRGAELEQFFLAATF